MRGVAVDVTAESAAAARDRAIVEAQRSAFDRLLATLSTPADIARLPGLSDDAISDMVLDFEVEEEQVSTVRYIGRLAFRFRAQPVRQYLEQNGVGYAVPATRPALVVPVLTRDGNSLLWDEGNAWLAAWSDASVGGPLVGIVVPLGDLSDIAAIDAPRALAGDNAALQALAQRYGAGDVVVAEAVVSVDAASDAASLALDARRYSSTGVAGRLQESSSAPGGEAALPDLYGQAAQRVSTFLQEEWKQENLVSSTAEQHLDVQASFTGLDDWVDLQRRLAEVTTVRRANIKELSRNRARLDLVFVGDHEQLNRALERRDLALVPLPGAVPVPGAAAGAPVMSAPTPAPAPGTGGAVTVDPGALPPGPPPLVAPQLGLQPQWELRRNGQARSSAIAPGAEPATAPQPAEPTAPPAAASDPLQSPVE